jgi:hypothetical protein
MQAERARFFRSGGATRGGLTAHELVTLDTDCKHVERCVAANDMPKAMKAYRRPGGMCGQSYEVFHFLPDLDGTGWAVHQNSLGAEVVGRQGVGNVPLARLSQLNRKGDAKALRIY